jgi:hypothetical protein
MSRKKHLRLLGNIQKEEGSSVKFNYGFAQQKEENIEVKPNYFWMATSLKSSLDRYSTEFQVKYSLRDIEMLIPANVDYIQINFVDQFFIGKYYDIYYSKFGLEGTSFSDFGRTGLFRVVDKDLFGDFLKQVNNFVIVNLDKIQDVHYSKYITYIKSFKLLTASDILQFDIGEVGNVVYLSVIELPSDFKLQEILVQSIISYLESKNIIYSVLEQSSRIELINPSGDVIKKIAENFDIIQSATCSISSVLQPSSYNVPRREYGFNIANTEDDLPIIGIIDTGISSTSPLSYILIADRSYTLGGDPLIDIAGRYRHGHGTAIAGLAALGRSNHLNQFQGVVNADAKLLSIKISERGSGYISEKSLLEMLYAAKETYPEMRLFVLTMCYSKSKSTNEQFSSYTYELDLFAYRTNSLIFICTANNLDCIVEKKDYDLDYFADPRTNLCTPADSMNNITVGAAAENLNGGVFKGISHGREYPGLYTRKGHIDLSSIYPKNKTNRRYFKPDVIECGGDFGFISDGIDMVDDSAMRVLSARPEYGYMYEIGTSLSAPLAANLAAKIIREYPSLNTQTIKALIVNGASLKNIQIEPSYLKNLTAGNGFIDVEQSLFSSENNPTIILEDIINHDEMKIYPFNFPDYLISDNLGRTKGILEITATLCFSFEPLKNHQVSYNPVHIAFSFFKNHTADQIKDKTKLNNSKLRSTLTWSQNGSHVSKPLPYSNVQKIRFSVDVNQLVEQKQTLKLAVQSRITDQIIGGLPSSYSRETPFSIVFSIEENLKNNTGKLYDEVLAINNLEVIQDTQLETTTGF